MEAPESPVDSQPSPPMHCFTNLVPESGSARAHLGKLGCSGAGNRSQAGQQVLLGHADACVSEPSQKRSASASRVLCVVWLL